MSKADAQRAMREANYAARNSGVGSEKAASSQGVKRPPARSAAPAAPRPEAVAQQPTGATCGHRSINGRECRREAGHAEKSHRYG